MSRYVRTRTLGQVNGAAFSPEELQSLVEGTQKHGLERALQEDWGISIEDAEKGSPVSIAQLKAAGIWGPWGRMSNTQKGTSAAVGLAGIAGLWMVLRKKKRRK